MCNINDVYQDQSHASPPWPVNTIYQLCILNTQIAAILVTFFASQIRGVASHAANDGKRPLSGVQHRIKCTPDSG
jgi:hypothetical protein